jgi:hypothetical protein
VKDPKLKPTAAMRLVIKSRSDWGATPETLLRRLQGKWKKDCAILLDAARERASRAGLPTKSVGRGDGLPSLSAIERAQKWADSPVGRATMGHVHSPAFQKLLSHVTSPDYLAQMSVIEKCARGMMDDPLQRKIHELQEATETLLGLNRGGRGLV